jgi:hypothetical protein
LLKSKFNDFDLDGKWGSLQKWEGFIRISQKIGNENTEAYNCV